MGRVYHVPFSATAVTAAVDVFEVLAASGKAFALTEVVISQSSDYGDAAAEGLSVLIKRATGTYTTGSGGSTVTPAKSLTQDAAAGPTAKILNTTQASAGTGALTTLRAEAFNVQRGYSYRPLQNFPGTDQRLTFAPGEACIVSTTAPADSLTISGTLVFEEF